MKKFLTKFFAVAISFLIFLSNVNLVQAKATNENLKSKGRIISKKVNQGLIDYANKQFQKHILVVSRNSKEFGFEGEDVNKFILGHPFSVYENKGGLLEGNQIYYFPIVGSGQIKAVLGVAYINGEYHATLQKAFAEEIENLIKNKTSAYRIVANDDSLTAVSLNDEIIISNKNEKQNSNKGKSSRAPIENIIKSDKLSNDEVILNEEDLKTPVNKIRLNRQDLKTPVIQTKITAYIDDVLYEDGPYEYNSIPMEIITQGTDRPWCWAATCAGIINYLRGENLRAASVVEYIYGYYADKAGTWSEIERAYNHWGLYPYQTDTLPYWQVKDNIDAMKPIHLSLDGGTDGHSVTLKGYAKYRDGNNVYILIDPNRNDTVTIDIKDDRNSMYYIINGTPYFWNYSRLGF